MAKIKLKTLLQEDINSETDSFVKKLRNLTSNNRHDDAVLALCKFMKNNKYEKIMNALKDIAKAEGNMPYELIQYRNTIQNGLMHDVEQKYGKVIASKINSEF